MFCREEIRDGKCLGSGEYLRDAITVMPVGAVFQRLVTVEFHVVPTLTTVVKKPGLPVSHSISFCIFIFFSLPLVAKLVFSSKLASQCKQI